MLLKMRLLLFRIDRTLSPWKRLFLPRPLDRSWPKPNRAWWLLREEEEVAAEAVVGDCGGGVIVTFATHTVGSNVPRGRENTAEGLID